MIPKETADRILFETTDHDLAQLIYDNTGVGYELSGATVAVDLDLLSDNLSFGVYYPGMVYSYHPRLPVVTLSRVNGQLYDVDDILGYYQYEVLEVSADTEWNKRQELFEAHCSHEDWCIAALEQWINQARERNREWLIDKVADVYK